MIPTPDMIRAAVVAGCAETGERPEDCIGRVLGVRARHYAMHALTHVCGRMLMGSVAAESVGCPGEGRHFYRNSINQTVAVINGKRRASWWNEAGYARTITAVEAAMRSAGVRPTALPVARSTIRAALEEKEPGLSSKVDRMFSTWHEPEAKPAPPPTPEVEAPPVAAAAPAKSKAVSHRANFGTVFRPVAARSSSTYERDAYKPVHGMGSRLRDQDDAMADLRQAILNTGGRLVKGTD